LTCLEYVDILTTFRNLCSSSFILTHPRLMTIIFLQL